MKNIVAIVFLIAMTSCKKDEEVIAEETLKLKKAVDAFKYVKAEAFAVAKTTYRVPVKVPLRSEGPK